MVTKLVEFSTKVTNSQAFIDVFIQWANEIVKDRLLYLDKWVDYMTIVHFKMIIKEKKMKVVTELEQKILKWAEIELISKDLQR